MALSTINSSGIKDDSIVNADIKSDAAIAKSKLASLDLVNADINASAAIALSKLASTPAVLTGSTNNQITTVTSANAIQGEANLTFDGSKLLINTTTEGAANADDLTIATTGTTGITIRSGDTNTGNIYFSDATTGTGEFAGAVEYSHDGDSLRLHANGNERFRISSDGNAKFVNNLGVGNVDSGGATLNVNGNVSVSAGGNTAWSKVSLSGSGNSSGDDFSINNWGDAEGDYWSIGVNSTANQSGSHAKTNDAKRSVGVLLDGRMGRMILQTSQTSTATIDSTHTWDRGGDYTLTGNVVIGTAGKGIDFSATGDGSGTDSSELFSDYEEGTFSPTMPNSGSASFAAVNEASYTKIGRRVWVNVNVQLQPSASSYAVPDNSTTFHIGGFPYSAGNYGGGSFQYTDGANIASSGLEPLMWSGNAIVYFHWTSTDTVAATNGWFRSNMSNKTFIFQISYIV
jgi:hypothetical protein